MSTQVKLTPDEPDVMYVDDIDDSIIVSNIIAALNPANDEKFMLNYSYSGYLFFSLMRSNFSTGNDKTVQDSIRFVLEHGYFVYIFANYVDFLAWINT